MRIPHINPAHPDRVHLESTDYAYSRSVAQLYAKYKVTMARQISSKKTKKEMVYFGQSSGWARAYLHVHAHAHAHVLLKTVPLFIINDTIYTQVQDCTF